jgi:hypothetical protein
MVGYVQSNEQDEQPAAPGATASSASEAGGHDPGSARERPPEGDPPLASDRAGAVAPEKPADPNSADWRYLYRIVHERYKAERLRGRALDQKVGVLLAGAIAAMAFTYAGGPNGWWSLVLLLFVVPLVFLLRAFQTRRGKDAPVIEALAASFSYYPVTTLRAAITAMVDAANFDRKLHDKKAASLDLAILTLGLAFIAVLLVLVFGRVTQPANPAAAVPTKALIQKMGARDER